jgi:hypothetical protein
MQYDVAYKAAMKPGATEAEKGALIRLAANASLDLDPPSYLPMREQLQPRIPDLCPDDMQRHKDGSARPPNCRCAEECWTDEDDAAWRKEWREST